MSKPVESHRASGTAPASVSPSSISSAAQPPKARPPSTSGPIHKGPPPNAVLIKVAKTLMTAPPSGAQPAPSSASASKEAAAPPTPVSVPAQCWYANPFQLTTNTPMTEFHRGMRGKVFFSPRAIPVAASELLSLPGERPPQLTVCEVGKDLIYGMAYLYNTPLSVEHQWRGRVAHLLRVRSHQAPIPRVVRRRAEAVATIQKQHEKNSSSKTAGIGEKPQKPASPAPTPSSPPSTAPPIDYLRTMCYERGEATVYNRPGDDLLMGIKVYVNDELVEDHYPIVDALPQCTATLPVKEAAQHWNCVPLVLMGYLNQLMLDPICVYHSLSLSFVEHLLRIKMPDGAAPTKGPVTKVPTAAAPGPKEAAVVPKKKSSPPVELMLRVEVVYGCRAEAYYCTDFICRGACTLRMTDSSKRALKAYEEKLRALVRLRLAAPQLIARSSGLTNGGVSPPPPRNCNSCGHPLQYRCTICGADVCGMPMCVSNAVVGYPRSCTRHLLPPN